MEKGNLTRVSYKVHKHSVLYGAGEGGKAAAARDLLLYSGVGKKGMGNSFLGVGGMMPVCVYLVVKGSGDRVYLMEMALLRRTDAINGLKRRYSVYSH